MPRNDTLRKHDVPACATHLATSKAKRGATTARCRCRLGCPGRAEDSAEHYSRCPLVADFATRFFGFSSAEWNFRMFFLCDTSLNSRYRLAAVAVLVYAASRTIHGVPVGAQLSDGEAYDCLESHALRGMEGHQQSRTLLAALFNRPPPVRRWRR